MNTPNGSAPRVEGQPSVTEHKGRGKLGSGTNLCQPVPARGKPWTLLHGTPRPKDLCRHRTVGVHHVHGVDGLCGVPVPAAELLARFGVVA